MHFLAGKLNTSVCSCMSGNYPLVQFSHVHRHGTLIGMVSKADFLSRHPGYHINLKRINGSAVETIFSQLKFITSGQLTSVTYKTAKASLLTKQTVHGSKTKNDYRDTKLFIRQTDLRRKK